VANSILLSIAVSRTSWQGKINALKILDLSYSSVKDAHLVKFMNLVTLEELNLDSCLVGDNAISHLADNNVVPNLTSLDLADTNVTDLGMVKIAKFQKLKRLSLFYCNITNNGLRHISKLTELEVLNLDSRDISDDGLTRLNKLTKLKSLDVFSGRITDAGCVHIAKIESLESLELCGGGIGDMGCSLLANLDNLTSLNLSQNDRITNRGAAALATLTNLKALNLSNTQVNASALRYFSGLLKLQSLALYGCRDIDDENVLGKLQCGLPNLRCLRLNTSSDEDGMVMTTGNDTDDEEDDEIDVDAADDDDQNSMDAAIWNHFNDDAMDEDATIYSDHD
jgi:Leucine-rich repeat (LRR) protein